jgi:hypothetical protein
MPISSTRLVMRVVVCIAMALWLVFGSHCWLWLALPTAASMFGVLAIEDIKELRRRVREPERSADER